MFGGFDEFFERMKDLILGSRGLATIGAGIIGRIRRGSMVEVVD